MNIHGLQKMTLLDFPGAVACTVFLGGCDFRCPYCHNAELLDPNFPPLMDETELLAFLKKRQGLLDGVCITGGEPLLRQELPTLLGEIRALGYKIKLDTNGAHPAQLRRILDAGLADYVAMDIKNSPERYAETIGRAQFDVAPIRESVRLLMAGDTDYEFRTTVVAELHGEEDIRAIGRWIAGARRYFLQPFTDRETVPLAGLSAPTQAQLDRFLAIAREFVPETQLRGA
ncbi:MAG: anaerobic ribonucleoside-triphosphate reductase activating protein [Ruminococcaceae bacterium]|nr:anaerobic ribonucleoside-triphosphate reductase activating protein [Oscillospiraceae bacterium]